MKYYSIASLIHNSPAQSDIHEIARQFKIVRKENPLAYMIVRRNKVIIKTA